MKSKKILTIFTTLLFFLLLSSVAIAETKTTVPTSGVLKGIKCIPHGDCNPCDFLKIFVNASNIIVGLSGTFAIIMFIYGGIVMLTAYGNEARITWGKSILTSTIIGILIVFLAWSFINIVIEALFGGSNINFMWQNVDGKCN